MIDPAYVRRMARYNRWQNENLYGCADVLLDEERRRERGAFFGSVHGTLSHLLCGDQIWMSRFAGTPPPEGGIPDWVVLHPDWDDLKRTRATFDATIIAWADGLDSAWFASDLTYYSGGAKRDITAPKWLLVTHMFNHQTHHRGQVHCMLTQAGGKPHDTDLPLLPELTR
jgi:uncharacterized damage-inducible protein DinB